MVGDPHAMRPCGKKVDNFKPGTTMYCQKCATKIDYVNQRYIAGVKICDHTGEEWMTVFDEVGAELFGAPASEFANNALDFTYMSFSAEVHYTGACRR